MMTLLFAAVLAILGFSVFHRPGWCNRPKASSLNRVRGGGIPS